MQKPETAYVCEAAIDAVSLFLIHRQQGKTDPAVYVSIGGAVNQQTIEWIKRKVPSVLAVDNDPAGNECRTRRNPYIPTLLPIGKDWNDDLKNNNPQ